MAKVIYGSQSKYARRIQNAFRRSRMRRGSITSGARAFAHIPRIPSYLRVKGTKAFQMTCSPVCLILGQGTGATQGINFYPLNGVPAVPAYINNSTFQLGWTLQGMQCSVNGALALVAPLTNWAEYTVLFDSYRIRKIELTMLYNSNSSSLGAGTSLPVISIVNDYDDTGTTPLTSLQQYDSYRLIQFGNNSSNGQVKHRCTPKIGTVLETTGGTAIAGSGSAKTWLDCNNTTVLYCGTKGNYDNMNIASAGVGFITMYCKMFVEFKNSR